MSGIKFQKEIPVLENNTNLVSLINSHCPELTSSKTKAALTAGAVWLKRGNSVRRIRRAKSKLLVGDSLFIYYNEAILTEPVARPHLISDEDQYSVWSKPRGMFSQGTKWSDQNTITRWVETHDPEQRPAFLVHRLDRATQGVIVIGHSKTVTTKLAQLFENRQVIKQYKAEVCGDFRVALADLCDARLIELPIDNKSAKTEILSCCFEPSSNSSRILLKLHTGRKHQIRRHLASLGYPIIGDRLYGAQVQSRDLQLTAYQLSFNCPVTQQPKSFQLADI
ncbi:RluA family pseudouridine synthase [Aliikangiella sp. IMCC44653]